MSARDEVAQTIADAADKYRALPGNRTPTTQDYAAADALIAMFLLVPRAKVGAEKLQERRDALAERFSRHSWGYKDLNTTSRYAVDAYIELEDAAEAAR